MYTKKPKEMGSQLMISGQVYCVNVKPYHKILCNAGVSKKPLIIAKFLGFYLSSLKLSKGIEGKNQSSAIIYAHVYTII